MAMNPFADHRDLYLLTAGVVLGVLLSPAVLGRVLPGVYEGIFIGPVAEYRTQLEDFDAQTQQQVGLLGQSGVTSVAIDELLAQRANERLELEAGLEVTENRIPALLLAIGLAVIVIMILETLVSPSPEQQGKAIIPPAVGRLVRLRYGLMALWLMILLARYDLLAHLPGLFLLLLIIVALILGFIPLGKKETPATGH